MQYACMLAAAVGMVGAMATPAWSVMITNNDDRSHTVVIEEKGETSNHDIAPASSLDGVCLEGCIATLKDAEDGRYSLPEGNEIVTIEDATLFYEGAAPAKVEEGGKGSGEKEKP